MHKGEHHELQHHQFRLKFTELNEIYIFNSLRSLAFTFIANFIPIYILLNKGDIKIVFLYYVIMYGGEFLMEPISAKLIRHYGPKHTISMSVPFLLAHFFLLQTLEMYNWPIWPVAVTGALGLSLFWQAYHYDFSKAKRKKKATRDVTTQFILLYVLAIIAPTLGGYFMDNGGPFLTFGISIVLLSLGTMALFKTSDKHEKTDKLDFSKLNKKSLVRDAASYAGYTLEGFVGMVAWQMFVFLIVGNYQDVGLAVSAMILLSVFVMYGVGKRSDKKLVDKMKYIKVGGVGKGVFSIARIFVTTLFGVYLVNIPRAVFGSLFSAPWTSEYYMHADEQPRSEYFMIMEMVVDATRALLALLLIGLAFFVEIKTLLMIALVIGGIGSIISSIIQPAQCEVKLNKKDLKVMPQPEKRGTK